MHNEQNNSYDEQDPGDLGCDRSDTGQTEPNDKGQNDMRARR
jgi:hypothetical protein